MPQQLQRRQAGSRDCWQIARGQYVLADSGFGILSVAYHTQQADHDVLFRLSMSRFKSHRQKAELIDQGESDKSYQMQWVPSPKERTTKADVPADGWHDVFINEVELEIGKTLAIVGSMESYATCLAELYRRRSPSSSAPC